MLGENWGLNQGAASELLWGCLLVWFLMSCLDLCSALYSPDMLILFPFMNLHEP